MSKFQRALPRFLIAILALALAWFAAPAPIRDGLGFFSGSDSNQQDNSWDVSGWYSDSGSGSWDGGGGWDIGGGGDSGSWDSGGGDSGSWDSGGGDSGSW